MTKQQDTLEGLLAIFEIRSKSNLANHVKELTISKGDLVNLILACDLESITLKHIPIFQHHHPEHLALTDENLTALTSNGIGVFNPNAQKAANQIFQMMDERRLFCGHMFWPPHLTGHWHLFYFDQRDRDGHANHWQGGKHIHLMNMLTHPQLDPNSLLAELFRSERPKLSGGVHIRFDDQEPDYD
jgi:hypothetical protein